MSSPVGFSRLFCLLSVSLGSWVLQSCKVPQSADTSSIQGDASDEVADLRWLERASRALRLGKSLGPEDPLKKYIGLPKSEAVDKLFQDPLFFATMMDFYSYYYGFKSIEGVSTGRNASFSYNIFDPKARTLKQASTEECMNSPKCAVYKTDFTLNSQISGHPAVLNGALSVVEGTTLDVLFKPALPRYYLVSSIDRMIFRFYGFSEPANSNTTTKPPLNIDEMQKKIQQNLSMIDDLAKKTIAGVKITESEKNPMVNGFCEKFGPLTESLSSQTSLDLLVENKLLAYCFQVKSISLSEIVAIKSEVDKMRANTMDAFLFLEQFLTMKLKVKHSTYVEAPQSLKNLSLPQLYGETFWLGHPNSSTNYNRRRAAYILKTFLCDDLTPVKLEIAKHPGDNRHASDPSCMACHYKLDPIAGFFRSYGIIGSNFDKRNLFVFDDGKRISGKELQKYRSTWDFPNKKGPNGGLKIGLIRSSTDQSKNSYGKTLEDLGLLLASDPRTHTCHTQRLADYFIGGGHTYDRKWLDDLAQIMTLAPRQTNGSAVKTVVKKLLLSKSFATQNPVEGVCYDRVQGAEDVSKLDCRVASIIDKYCTKCHGSGSESGGLDLSQWSESKGFKHEDEAGKANPIKVSYQKILNRLGPSKDGPIMPLNSPMPDPERQILLQWFDKQLQ